MLETLLHATIRIDGYHEASRPYLEGVVIEADGSEHLIRFYEGQLKDVAIPVEVGKTYRATFLPFVNNRWVELRLTGMEELGVRG